MKFLAHLATNSIIITRLGTVSGYRQAFATVTGFIGNVQPLSPSKVNLYEGVMGKTFIIYCDGALDILEGDKLRDINSGTIYKVKNGGVSRRTFGSIDFKEVIVEELS